MEHIGSDIVAIMQKGCAVIVENQTVEGSKKNWKNYMVEKNKISNFAR